MHHSCDRRRRRHGGGDGSGADGHGGWSWTGRAANVGAADHDRRLGRGHGLGQGALGGQGPEVDRHASGAQAGQGRANTAETLVGVEGDGGGVGDDARHQTRQHGAAADLDEDGGAGLGHRPDFLDEAHRGPHLLRQGLADDVHVVAVGGGGGVGKHRHRRRLHGSATEGLEQGLAGGSHQRRVKRRRHGELLDPQPGLFDGGDGFVDGGFFAGDDGLVGSVVVGEDHATNKGRKQRREAAGVADDGGHGPRGGRRRLHQFATATGQPQQGRLVKHARRAQGAQLAKGVAGGHVHRHAEALQHAHGRDARKAEGGLGVFGLGQGLLLGGAGGVVKRRRRVGGAHHVGEHVAAAVPHGAGVVEGQGHGLAHLDHLAALTGEDEGGGAVVLALAPEDRRAGFAAGHLLQPLRQFVDRRSDKADPGVGAGVEESVFPGAKLAEVGDVADG